MLFATVTDPYLLVAVQFFDGITAAVFGVLIPLIVADIAFGSGHFNLAQGVVGTATGIGASLSTVLAGYVSDHLGHSVAFLGLSAVGCVGLVSDRAGDAGDETGVRLSAVIAGRVEDANPRIYEIPCHALDCFASLAMTVITSPIPPS